MPHAACSSVCGYTFQTLSLCFPYGTSCVQFFPPGELPPRDSSRASAKQVRSQSFWAGSPFPSALVSFLFPLKLVPLDPVSSLLVILSRLPMIETSSTTGCCISNTTTTRNCREFPSFVRSGLTSTPILSFARLILEIFSSEPRSLLLPLQRPFFF